MFACDVWRSASAGCPGRAAESRNQPAAIQIAGFYNGYAYTYTVLVTLGDFRFCAEGEPGPPASSGILGPGGDPGVNVGGGQFSGHYLRG